LKSTVTTTVEPGTPADSYGWQSADQSVAQLFVFDGNVTKGLPLDGSVPEEQTVTLKNPRSSQVRESSLNIPAAPALA
jgi:hypothetical protein